jgi:hypothetical protein
MKYINIVFVLLSICLLYSCNIRQNTYSGKYGIVYRGGNHVPYVYSLKLNIDSTFDYSYSCGWIEEISNGTWTIDSKSNIIFLHSNIDNVKNIPININESSDININSKELYFVNPTKNSTLWSVVINGNSYPIKSDKITIPDGIKIDSLYLIGYDDFTNITPNPLQDTVRSEIYHIRNNNNNIIKVNFQKYVDYKIFNYKPIVNSFSIKRKYIMWQKGGAKLRKLP